MASTPDHSAEGRSERRVDRRIWIDGELVPWEEATVHLLSHSHQRGSLVFDYMSVHATAEGDAVFRVEDHARRFVTSCELVGLPIAQGVAEVRGAILEACRANPGARAAKVCAYLASVEVDVVPVDDHVTLAVAAYDPVADVARRKARRVPFAAKLKLWIEKQARQRRPDIIPAQAKVAANYVSPMMAKWKARRAGYDEIVLVDHDGFLAEGPTTNLFLVDREGTLLTPPVDNVLPGITRLSVLELAKHHGIPVREAPVRPEALLEASEVFLTGTSAGVWPVESVDGRSVGEGSAPGPVASALAGHFRRAVAGEDPAFAHWLTPVGAGGEGAAG